MANGITQEGLILMALRNSTLTEELRDAEIDILARIVEVHEYRAGEVIVSQAEGNYASGLGETLMMLGCGEVEVTFATRGETAVLTLSEPGEVSTILGFVGGDISRVGVGAVARTDCAILTLERARFESLLASQPAIAYYFMRGLVRYVHGIVRRLNTQAVAMTNYLYSARPA